MKHTFCYILFILTSLQFFVLSAQNKELDDDVTVGLHRVEQGETLYRISRNFFLTEKDIMEVNIGLTAENLKAGQLIKIPITTRNKDKFTSERSNSVTEVQNETFVVHKHPKQKLQKSTKLNIALMLPLNYEEIDKLTFTKFNIDEKKRQRYKCFEYINFYEGARIALDVLEKEGYNIECFVYDVGENDTEKMREALSFSEMKDMDLIVPLVFKNPFAIAADFAKANKIPIVNPMSSDIGILQNNYTFKIQPSAAAEVETVVRYIRSKHSDDNIIIIHDNRASIKPSVDYYEQLLSKSTMMWTIMDYNKYANKLTSKISTTKNNVLISLVASDGKSEAETFAKRLLSVLSSKKGAKITLFGDYSWCEFNSLDFELLEKFDFHFTLSYLNDYSNANFVNFVKLFRKHFKTEPDKFYAALGYDIITYFVHSLIENGVDFMETPNISNQNSMINPYYFERPDETRGYQNKRTVVYKIDDYKIKSVGR